MPLAPRATRPFTLVAAAALLALAACGGDGGGADDDAADVRALVERQVDLFRANDWPALYETYAPALRERCTYDEFLRAYEGAEDFDLDRLRYEDLAVRIEGDRAYATYVVRFNGEEVERADEAAPDEYVRVDGAWYDAPDSHTPCE